ncbi:hypothetical protein [Caulobacter segnis]
MLAKGYDVSSAWGNGDAPGLRQLIDSAPTPPVEVPSHLFPSLIAFSDLLRPETGQLVDPGNLAGGRQGSPRVERLEIQIVDEPVSRGSVAKLAWLRPRSLAPELVKWNDFRKHPEYFSR